MHVIARSLVAAWLGAGMLLVAARGQAPRDDASLPLFHADVSEIQIRFSVIEGGNVPVNGLTAADFQLLRDGDPIAITSLRRAEMMPVSLRILTDASDSMSASLPLVRAAQEWIRTRVAAPAEISFVQFAAQTDGGARGHLTSLYDAVFEAAHHVPFGRSYRRALILFSDGDDNCSNRSLGEAIVAAQEVGTTVFAITVHKTRDKFPGDDNLKALAEETGGRFFVVNDEHKLQAALQEIDQSLNSEYELTFRSAKQPGLHEIMLAPISRKLRLAYQAAYVEPREDAVSEATPPALQKVVTAKLR
jgi:hypothetical protein